MAAVTVSGNASDWREGVFAVINAQAALIDALLAKLDADAGVASDFASTLGAADTVVAEGDA